MGSGGRTTFYINGRLQGFVPRQVTADVLRLGNHPAGAEGAADGAAGVLADVRLYGSALDASAVRELFVSASLPAPGAGSAHTKRACGAARARPRPPRRCSTTRRRSLARPRRRSQHAAAARRRAEARGVSGRRP